MTFLGDLINEASGDRVATPVLLRRMKVLAARLKTIPLTDWIEHELSGYGTGTPLPAYRGPFPAEARGSFSGPWGSSMSNAPIPSISFEPEHRKTFEPFFTIEFRQSVAELEELLRVGAASSGNLHLPWPADAVAYANQLWMQGHVHWYEGMGLTSAHTPVSEASIKGVLDTVRTRVLNLALALESEDPHAGDTVVSSLEPVQATQIFYTTVMGGGSNVAVGSRHFSQAVEARPQSVDDLVARLRALGLGEDLLAELREAIEEDEQASDGRAGEPGTHTRARMARQDLDDGGEDGRTNRSGRIRRSRCRPGREPVHLGSGSWTEGGRRTVSAATLPAGGRQHSTARADAGSPCRHGARRARAGDAGRLGWSSP